VKNPFFKKSLISKGKNITLNFVTFPPSVQRLRDDKLFVPCTTSRAQCPCQGLSNLTKYIEREDPRFGRFMAWSHPNKQNRKNTDLNIQISYPRPPLDFLSWSAFLSAKKTMKSVCSLITEEDVRHDSESLLQSDTEVK